MISSVDGKISTGDKDSRDIDKDFPYIKGVAEGLNQYYELEKWTDLHSFNTGRVMEKIGMNKEKDEIKKLPVSFIIVDNKPHLNSLGVSNLLRKCKTLYLITTNKNHPAFKLKDKNLKIIFYNNTIDFTELFEKLKNEYAIEKVTIQSGSLMNSILIREKLIDRVSLVIAPALIGGKDTPSLVGGASLGTDKDLEKVRALKLVKSETLKSSYIHLVYEVIN